MVLSSMERASLSWSRIFVPVRQRFNAWRYRRAVRALKGDSQMSSGQISREEARLLRGFDRLTRSAEGVVSLKYTAIDPADRYVGCKCEQADCWTKELLPLRQHMAVLYRAINACGYAEQFEGYDRGDFAWPGVTDAIQMAASIDDVFTDPAYIDDSDAFLYCESVADFDAREREYAAKYTAAMIIFNFVWNAYEAAIEISAGNAFPKDKTPVRARRLFAEEVDLHQSIKAFERSLGVATHVCSRVPELAEDIAAITTKYKLSGAAAAAELCRIFRNYIVHGRDDLPTNEGHQATWRFYAIIRLLLLLVQLLVMRRLVDRQGIVPLSINGEGEATTAGAYLANLHRRQELWFSEGEFWFEREPEDY
jgi:hypothetical protein